MSKPKLGELLLEAKVLTAEQLAEALALPRAPGQKLGQLLVERGLLSEALLTQVLSRQLTVPWVALQHVEFSRPLLDLVPGELADRFGLVPILVRSQAGRGDTLVVAMEDPLVDGAVEAVAEFTGLRVKAMIASQSDVRAAIRSYYGLGAPPMRAPAKTTFELEDLGGELVESPLPLAVREIDVAPPSDPFVPDEVHSIEADEPGEMPLPEATDPSEIPSEAPPPASGSDVAPPTVAADVLALATAAGKPVAKKRGRRVTLLDGTTVFVPEKARASMATGDPTALELVATLRALSAGKSAQGGNVDWEPLVGALLSVLLRKRLVSDWELVEELRKFTTPK